MSNVITIPGLAPRQKFVPRIRSDDLDEVRAQFTLSHAQYIIQSSQYIAANDGVDAAINALTMAMELIRR